MLQSHVSQENVEKTRDKVSFIIFQALPVSPQSDYLVTVAHLCLTDYPCLTLSVLT